MKIKLDENLGRRVVEVFRKAGHDATTVRDQNLQGVRDEALYGICRQEGRCLVTVDLDFADVLRFPPEETAGIAVLRPAGRVTIAALVGLVSQIIAILDKEPLAGRLWIVEPGRIRVHQPSDLDLE